MQSLSAGENTALASTSVTIGVVGDVDLTALVLSDDGKVRGDADMVFFNNTSAPGVTLAGSTLTVALDALRPGAERVALVASPAAEGRTFGQAGAPALTVTSGGASIGFTPAGLTSETALVLVELYRRNGQWKLKAVGAGYSSGLAGVATDYGIEVEEQAPPPPAISMTKEPIGRISLAKSGSAKIPMTKEDRGTLVLATRLEWKGRKRGPSDLDLYALYVDDDGRPGVVYYRDLGSVQSAPWIQLDGDSTVPGVETMRVVAGRSRYVLLCAYSAVENGVGSFKSYDAQVVIDDGAGSTVTVPLFKDDPNSYWVAIARIDFTDPTGAKVEQIEAYGRKNSENRPVLHPDGRVEMSAGVVEFKGS